ncbi:response regulator [Sphingomonas montanisoli]|uniref:Response regulator n=1 Tax=Sphingomonas montanisoli TaxID=2606412 RepID=A0A5D9C3T6_9SPHN|nr:response regulator [Sphingomonas montanisoli]TZG25967.1 response regulator [Sphingomonas montanisoli]
MRFLIVEDDENKRVQLDRFVRETYPFAELEESRSLQSGLRQVRTKAFDLILLDMTLPNYEAGPDEPGGGTTHSFGGREFLKQMDRFNIRTPVVVVTQFETFGKPPQSLNLVELDAQLNREHAVNYRGAVYYHASIHGWRERLRTACEVALDGDGSAGAEA